MSEATARDMIQHALDQDFNKANEVFGEIMSVKISDILDQEKINLAAQIYNDEDPEDDDYELGDEDDVQQQDDADLDGEDWEEEDLEDGSDVDAEAESDPEEDETEV
jgi:hypothetical protein